MGGDERLPTVSDGTEVHAAGAEPPVAVQRVRLVVIEGPSAGQERELGAGGGSIGSHALNDLELDDPTVSRFHCELRFAPDGLMAIDLGSTNRTLVDGVAVREAFLRHGSVVRLGHAAVRVELGAERVSVPQVGRFGSLVGASAAMRATLAQLARAGDTDTTVLLEGETGTGKGQAAEALHRAGGRRDRPFGVVDCGGIPENLLESELFGHEKGAFTSADARRIGAFEEASGGTLFLDEIGELPLTLQPKLLRALESREIRRVGSNRFLPVDLRVIAATNRDLRADVNAGRFRADLYYRLAVVKIRIPPLRERPDDLPALVEELVAQVGAPPGSAARLMTRAWLDAAQRSPWPGNVRELRNHVERSLLFEHAPAVEGGEAAPRPVMPFVEARRIARDAFERGYLEALMHQFDGRVGPAAEAARVDRVYLYRLLRRQGIPARLMNPGEVIAGRFAIERFAARGGMGAVYRARDLRGDALAAVKVLQAGDPAAVERFARESRLLQQLHHPGIVRYLEHGRSDGGELYLAMEWLDGEDLAARLGGTELAPADSLQLATNVAAALAAAHARRIVHRDLKPSNLFLVDWQVERVKVLDFGIARLGGGDRLTETGAALGTPGYMAPEQIAGAADIDARADVFALGAVLFRCLAGRPAFVGATVGEIIAAVLQGNAPRVRDFAPAVPDALDALVARMLATDRARRPRDAGLVLAELMALDAAGGPTEGPQARLTTSEIRVLSVMLAEGAAAEAVARAHGARVERRAGRTSALFLEQVASDLARRAARCALAVRQREPEAAVALVTARGDAAALEARAARLLGGAGIRIDAATAGLLDARFEVGGDRAGLLLHAERDADDAPRTVLGKTTPFVGRDREMAMLDNVLAECSGEGLARPVLVVAAAGMGKSRLRQELVARLRARGDEVEVWTGRGDPMRAGAPFAILGDALRRAAGVTSGEPLAVRRALLRERVERAVGPARAQAVAELIGEVAGVPFPDEDNPKLRAARREPQLLADLTRAAWEELLAAECAVHPVLLILEDLHWGDLPSVRHVDAALRALAERPFMVLGLARPEVHALFPRLWAERGLQEMHLGPLSRRAAERLVKDVLGAVDARELGAVVDGAGGHAFFLEELIRQAAEGSGAQAPETVLAMVASRLEGMEPDARRALRAAAVLGETFWAGAVRALAGDARLDHWLDLLVEREIIRRSDRSRFPGEPEHRFAHALVREAAYGMLTDDDRARGHQLAGAWLEGMGETEAAVLAEHFERGRDRERAASWYRRAAEQALAGNDLDAAIARAESGAACGAAGEELGGLRLTQAAAHRHRGDNVAAQRASLEAMRHLPAGGAAWSVAAGEAAAASGKLDHVDELRRIAEELAALPAAALRGAAQAVALARTATQCFACEEPEVGRALLARVDGEGDPGVKAWIDGALGFAAYTAGRPELALRHQRASRGCFEQAGDARNACYSGLETSWVLPELGAFDELEELLPTIVEADRLGLHSAAKMARALVAQGLADMGRLDEALELATEAVVRFPELTQPRIVSITRRSLGVVLLRRGDLARAEPELRLAIGGGRRGTPYNAANGYLALVRVAQGDPAEALALARVAEARLDPARGIVPHEPVVRLAVAEALAALGRDDDARAALRLAADRLRAIAAEIESPAYRESFTRRTPVHRRTLELAAAAGV